MKQHYTIGCCGIDCGLCPRYHTDGPSACPGCGAPNFKDNHPSCAFVTCCVTKHGYETCADCPDYPCSRFNAERKGHDSFVTHRKVFENLNDIRKSGQENFLKQQKQRMDILINLLGDYNEGRSKGFYCQICALMPLEDLVSLMRVIHYIEPDLSIKDKARQVRTLFNDRANILGIELELRE